MYLEHPCAGASLCGSLPNSVFRDGTLVALNRPRWNYFHHANWHMLQIGILFCFVLFFLWKVTICPGLSREGLNLQRPPECCFLPLGGGPFPGGVQIFQSRAMSEQDFGQWLLLLSGRICLKSQPGPSAACCLVSLESLSPL